MAADTRMRRRARVGIRIPYGGRPHASIGAAKNLPASQGPRLPAQHPQEGGASGDGSLCGLPGEIRGWSRVPVGTAEQAPPSEDAEPSWSGAPSEAAKPIPGAFRIGGYIRGGTGDRLR
ncbi:MAG: hypothetical protein A2X88_06295 [Deltaproteobacteria bacterium GWC2_65_14]|nr:MAG: hypothetical protein A2X88_06295 [Deltaproteobacteria bacterium GWC2_65_14]